MKNLREYWGNIGIIGAMLTNTLLPVCVGGWVWLCVFVLVCLCSCMYVYTYYVQINPPMPIHYVLAAVFASCFYVLKSLLHE